ncbi:MAG: hypothetical protein JXR05_11360 [Flavobacteriaceae bacterium]
MKKLLIILLAISALSCKTQQVIIPVEKHIEYQNDEIEFPNNAYLKDVNNLLDKYVGVWKKTQNNKIYEFHVIKVARESNDEYMQFKKDELEIRYKITNAVTGNVIVDTTILNEGPYVIKGKHFNLDKTVYSLYYIGLNNKCGQNGIVFIYFHTSDLNQMNLFLSVNGGTVNCPTGQVPQVLPTDAITLIKQ